MNLVPSMSEGLRHRLHVRPDPAASRGGRMLPREEEHPQRLGSARLSARVGVGHPGATLWKTVIDPMFTWDLRQSFSWLVTLIGALALGLPSAAFGGPTIVSLTFDDGWDTQQTAYSMLAAHGQLGTFYVNSGTIGTPGHLTWSQLDTFNAAGNEIGGHTLTHPDLTTLSSGEAQHEVCDDRTNILGQGFVVNNFAYPFGGYDSNTGNGPLDVSSIVQGCGYASGRGAFGLHNITATNDTRPYATSTSPPDPYKILTPCCINYAAFGGSTPTAAALESYVQHAESGGGGWVILFFHRICDNCNADSPAPSMSPSEFNAFLDWLQSTSSGAQVKTVAQAISGDGQTPTSSIACGGTACSSGSYGGPVNVSLSATDTGSGVAAIHYTTDGSDPTVASPTYSGPFSVSGTTTVKYRAWDKAGNVEATNSQLIQIDTAAPTSTISCGGSSCSTGWYNGPVSVSLSATDDGSGVAAIRYTTNGSDPTASSTAYTAPFTVSATATVKYRAWDNAGNVEATKSQLIQIDTTAPTSTITCNAATCSTGWYQASVTVRLAATDAQSGIAAIRYTTDGSTPTAASSAYTAPFSVTATTTVKYRAWDNAGNVEATKSQLIQIDATSPTVSITAPSNGASVTGSVKITAAATDAGSGIAQVSFYADGVLVGTARNAPYDVAWNTKKASPGQHILTAVAQDRAGNTQTSAAIQVTVR
jgi:peptidoglycan/xylan/chitin deacetylase (PgdA/CDA1 family)